MNFEQVYTELKKANRTVHSAYDNADLNGEAMLNLRDVVLKHDAAMDEFTRLFADMFEGSN